MIRHADSQLFWNDTVHKDWLIEIEEDNVTLTNEDILVDELTIQESLCSDQDITLGSCVASTFEVKVFNKGREFKGKTLRVSLVLDGHTNNPIPIGVYKVDEDTLEEDERIRDIKAYDALYEILDKDCAPWFNEDLPEGVITLKEFRDSFMEYAGIEQEEVNLINDWIPFNFVIANSAQTQKMIEEENERIQQLREQSELGVVLYRYNAIDLNTYDPSKKDTTTRYDLVQNVQPNDNPRDNHWHVIYNDEYVGCVKTTVDYTYKNIQEATVHTGDNPHALGLYQKNTQNTEDLLELTPDTSPEPRKTYYNADHVPIDYYTATTTTAFNPYKLGWYIQSTTDPSKYELAPSSHVTPQIGVTYYEKEDYKIDPPTYKEVIGVKATDNPTEKKWYEYNSVNQKYERSTDTTADLTKMYFEKCLPENRASAMLQLNLATHTGQNPKENGWYEMSNDAYIKTPDTTITYTKKYYINIWEIDQNDQSDIIYDEIKGSEIITAICEINCCFGHIDREGVFRYVQLKPIDYEGEGLYPAPDLYPDPNLYPAGQPADWEIDRSKFETCEKESYTVKKLDRLVICKEDGDNGYVYPEGSRPEDHNTYKIQGNFIWYNFTESRDTLNIVGNNILTHGIAQISEYTPCDIDLMGNPCIEVGDTIKVITRLGTFFTYVLQRTISGSQRLTDDFKIQGNEKRSSSNSIYNAVIELKGKANILTRNVDMTRNEIIDMGENMSSLIEQTAEAIKFEVSKEVKNVEDNVTDKYQSAIKYTAEQIAMTVSRTMYDADKTEMQEWRSGIEINYNSISAEVSNTVKSTGVGIGFRWELTENGWLLQAKGQYTKRTESPTAELIAVQDPTGKNPMLEEWHEKDAQGYPFLTIDTTPQAGKTYYKTTISPAARHWLEIVNGAYVETQDTNIKTSKTYYSAEGTSNFENVFVVNSQGVWVRDAITTRDLDVANVATIGMLRSTYAEIENLDVKIIGTQDDVTGLRNRVNEIYTRYLNANYIKSIVLDTDNLSADKITGGKLSADCIDVANLFKTSTCTAKNFFTSGTLTAKSAILDGLHMNGPIYADVNGEERKLTPKTQDVMDPNGHIRTIYYLEYDH